MTFAIKLEKTLKKILKAYCQLYFSTPIYHWWLIFQHYQDWICFHKIILSVNNEHKCIPLSIIVCSSLIVKVISGTLESKKQLLLMKTHCSSKSQCIHHYSLTVKKISYYFPPLNDSNSFGTVDYDNHMYTKIVNTSSHLFKSMTLQELDVLHHVSELERTQLLAILAMSVQNPQLAGYL